MRKLLALLLIVACGAPEPAVPAGAVSAEEPVTAGSAFQAAEARTGVPAALLAAVAQAETGVQMVVGHEHHGRPAACGVMALRTDILAEAARRAGVSEHAACHELGANVLAAASLLDAWATEAGIQREDLAAWAPVVARYGGIAHAPAAAEYVHTAVYGALRRGVRLEGVTLGRIHVTPDFPAPPVRRNADAPGVIWRPSDNHNSRRGTPVSMVIVHTCEGAYSGCWGWLADPDAPVSAHYVVKEDGSEVSQLVEEADRAWHIGADYLCSRNSHVRCDLNGTQSNDFTVGIEHAGYAAQTSFDEAMVQRSAELLCDITRDHGIPIDAQHVVGHGQLQPYNRTDPGTSWPWADYLARAREACGEEPPGPVAGQWVIDSNNAANATDRYLVEVSDAWASSTGVSGWWNTGYWVAPTEPASDPARFRFLLDDPACLTVEAWWTAGGDRSSQATWLGWDDQQQEVGRASVDQRARGSQWVHLGDWSFPAGWNEVLLSRWANPGAVVVADAVRLTPSGACAVDPCAADRDDDGTPDCDDTCPDDATKREAGTCGCGIVETDGDDDGVPDCADACPDDPDQSAATACGCGVTEEDGDGDGVPDCVDVCPEEVDDQADADRDGVGDACEGAATEGDPSGPRRRDARGGPSDGASCGGENGGCAQAPVAGPGILALLLLLRRVGSSRQTRTSRGAAARSSASRVQVPRPPR